MAKLSNSISYAQVINYKPLERDHIYFYDLGLPLGDNYTKLDAIKGYIRFFEKGFVLVSEAYKNNKYLEINSSLLPKTKIVLDTYTHTWLNVSKHKIKIKLHFIKESFSDKYAPLGRVFLYEI